MKRPLQILLVLLAVLPPGAAAGKWDERREEKTKKELVAIAQTLMDAISPGDKAVFDRWLADDLILIQRDGTIMRKKEIVDGTTPMVKGFSLDRIEAVEPEVRVLDDSTAVLVYRVIEDMTVFGQKIHVQYRSSHTFAKRNGEWKIVVWQYVEIPRDPDPTPVKTKVYDDYLGEYAFGERRMTIARKGDKLYFVRNDKETELVPESEAVFHVPGSEFRKIFVRDASGKVTTVLDRRKGTDVKWTRVTPAAARARLED